MTSFETIVKDWMDGPAYLLRGLKDMENLMAFKFPCTDFLLIFWKYATAYFPALYCRLKEDVDVEKHLV